ncbi:MAG: IPT/TIG domain-containing protein, partial [Planctomycetota bacterium]
MRYLIALLLLAGVSLAQEIDSVRPECAAPGDYVLIQGSDFGEEPTVLFDDVEADVVKNRDDKILVRVPAEGLDTGAVTIDVDGATADFTVLEAGAPIILHVSATKATPGMVLILIGARLAGGTAAFVDADDVVAATVDLKGGRRASFLKIPSDLAAGTYTLVITNPDDIDSGDCSPTIEIVEAGTATVTAITPDEQTPGRGVVCEGTDLGPFGYCYVSWTDSEDATLESYGFANGYDKVYTRVPFRAEAGATYDVVIEFADGTTTGAFSYDVGTLPAPTLTELEYDTGPAGDTLGILGENLFSGHKLPKVEFTDGDGVATEADVLWAFPHHHHYHGKRTSKITVRIPASLADGEYDVTVTTNTGTSNALVFTVADLELTVTAMKPTGQGE